MNHKVTTIIILSVFVILCLGAYIFFIANIFPFNSNKIKEPMTNTWVSNPHILERDAANNCGKWCGGIVITPELREIYEIESNQQLNANKMKLRK